MHKVYSKRQMAKQLAFGIHVVILVITATFAIINYNSGLIYSSLCCLVLSLNSIVCAYLHVVKNKFELSNILTFVVLNINLTILGYLEGVMSGYHLHFFTMLYAIPFFLRIRKNGISKLNSLVWYLVAIIFISSAITVSPLYSEVYSLSVEVTHQKLMFNSIGSFMAIIIFSLMSIQSTNRYATALEVGKLKAESEKEARTRVLSNLGHELRTQITSINGVIQLITEDKKNSINDEANEDYYSILKYCNAKMLFLVNDVLDMHKIEVGKFKLFLESKNLGDLLSKVTLPFDNKAKTKGIELNTIIDKRLSDIIVRVDDSRLTQVFHNLISNAIKFTSRGGVAFKAEVQNETDNSITILFNVIDTGIGISKNNHIKIFDSFLQIKEEDKPIYGGTGLGLAISKTIIEKMDATIGVDSVVDRGSNFFFQIEFSKSKEESSEECEETFNDDFLRDTTILIVEDNAVNMLYTNKLINGYGAKTYQAEDGDMALRLVEKHLDIDLVLLDLEMPKMNGFTAIKHIKKERPKLKVVAFTANIPEQEILKRLIDLGFDDLVSKPFKKEELFSVMKRNLSLNILKRSAS